MVYAVDDLLAPVGDSGTVDGGVSSEEPDAAAFGNAPAITARPKNATARLGDYVSFSVEAPGASSYQWECTDSGTDGWYEIHLGGSTSANLAFELTSDVVWMKDCEFRCRVTFEDGSVEYSDPARFEYREMGSWGSVARKVAHTVEFLPVGLFAAGLATSLSCSRGWGRRRVFVAVVAFCLLCSLDDQVHKVFVPGREFDAVDMLFDAAGYGFGIILCIILSRILFRIQTGPVASII